MTDPKIYQNLFEMGKSLLAITETDQLLTVAMDNLIEISGAERGMIILFGEEGDIQFETARNIKKKDIDKPGFEISRTLIDRVKSEGAALCLRNALDDPTLQMSKSVERLKILSVICLPLVTQEKVFGVIYLDNRTVRGVFKPEINTFVQEFADFISLAAYRALEYNRLDNRVQKLEEELRSQYDFEAIVGHSPRMVKILQTISQVADTDATVLIEGETGTGKELVARSIHFNSPRKDGLLVNINCGAIPENLLESELFGYEKGAFTGAYKSHKGKFEQADGGTIFLDEVDEMSPALQVKVLRILQWGEFSPLGSDRVKRSDVRVVAASKQSLRKLVEEGKFRDDLFYRLNLIHIEMPSLRERREDILLLVNTFLREASESLSKQLLSLSPEVKRVLQAYDYPGNVRELENIVRRAAILCEKKTISLEHLPPEIGSASTFGIRGAKATIPTFREAKEKMIDDFERQYIQRILAECSGVVREAARRAGMHPKNFHEKMNKYGIHVNKTKTERNI